MVFRVDKFHASTKADCPFKRSSKIFSNQSYKLIVAYKCIFFKKNHCLPGPFAPPDLSRPSLKTTALSYSWTTCTHAGEKIQDKKKLEVVCLPF